MPDPALGRFVAHAAVRHREIKEMHETDGTFERMCSPRRKTFLLVLAFCAGAVCGPELAGAQTSNSAPDLPASGCAWGDFRNHSIPRRAPTARLTKKLRVRRIIAASTRIRLPSQPPPSPI